MKKITLLLLLTYCSFFSMAQEKEVKKEKVYYSTQQLEEDEYWNTYIYPSPDMASTELLEFLKKRVSYPDMAKKYFHTSSFTIPLHIDIKGKATLGDMILSGNTEFEDIATSILADSGLTWKPARKNKKLLDMDIRVPVSFYTVYANNKLYFKARFFIHFEPILLDSTDTYPAMILIDGEKNYTMNSRYFLTPGEWNNDKMYGNVNLGFEIDTMGVISDQKILTSISEPLDKEAMNFINETNGKWIPARKNGVKVPSYKYFDCLFNDVYVNQSGNSIGAGYISQRKRYEKDLNKGLQFHYTIAMHNKREAMGLLAEKKYEEALIKFNRAAKYYTKDANLFFNRSIAYHYTDNSVKSCDDLQRVLEIAETEGFPLGITKQQVEELIVKFCQ